MSDESETFHSYSHYSSWSDQLEQRIQELFPNLLDNAARVFTCSSLSIPTYNLDPTFLFCCSADGAFLHPLAIVPYTKSLVDNKDGELPVSIVTNDSGVVNKEIFTEWFKQIHIPLLLGEYKNKSDVLFFLSPTLASLVTAEVSQMCFNAGIILHTLPDDTEHFVQPLDLGFFPLFVQNWETEVTTEKKNFSNDLWQKEFNQTFLKVFNASKDVIMIKDDFRKSGIFPFNKIQPNFKMKEEEKSMPKSKYMDQSQSQASLVTVAVETALPEVKKEIFTDDQVGFPGLYLAASSSNIIECPPPKTETLSKSKSFCLCKKQCNSLSASSMSDICPLTKAMTLESLMSPVMVHRYNQAYQNHLTMEGDALYTAWKSCIDRVMEGQC